MKFWLLFQKKFLGEIILKKKFRNKKTISEINVTPFVDVMLVLLIIFMVTAPLLTSGIKINLPESSSVLKNEKKDPVTVSINSIGEIFIQKKKNKNLKIYIKGDKKLDYGRVMDLMNLINQSGFKKVALVTKLQ